MNGLCVSRRLFVWVGKRNSTDDIELNGGSHGLDTNHEVAQQSEPPKARGAFEVADLLGQQRNREYIGPK